MSKLRYTLLASITAISLMLMSCGGLNTMLKEAPNVTYKVTPGVLELHGDSVEITITGQYPPKFFNKKAVMDVTPVIKWEGGEYAFRTEKLQGEQVEANAKIISYETGGTFTYTDKIAYTPEMAKSELVVRAKASIKESVIDLPEYKLADGVITTPLLVQEIAQTITAADQFKRTEELRKEAQIMYLINQANIRGGELSKGEVKMLRDFIATAKSEESHAFAGVSISSYASPDGSISLNERLSKNRDQAARAFISKELTKVEEAKSSDFVKSEVTSEDWEGFKRLVQASNINDKELIIRVLEMYSDPVVREKEIKNISMAYNELRESILPQLRRSRLTVNVNVEGKTDSLLLAIGADETAVDTMTIEEFLKAATLTIDDYAKKETILKNAAARHPQEWRAFNNLGVLYFDMAKYDNALEVLQKADEISEGSSMVKNNIGAAYFMKGDRAKAKEYYDLAAGAGRQVSYNQAVLKIKEGDYKLAVELLGSTPSFNASLAKLLVGDTNGAMKAIQDADNQDAAITFYLKAVIGARTANQDLMIANLRTACEKDPALKAKASKDMDFAKYFEDAAFKAIVL
jgi:tetratricopeptide (TPR) repeat protein